MGYRSDIYIKAKHEAFPQLITALKAADFSCDIREDGEYFYITLEGYKWYPSYSDVDSINNLVAELGNQNLATMLRIGEEDGDIETYGADPYDLDLHYHTNVELDGFDEQATAATKLKETYPEYFI